MKKKIAMLLAAALCMGTFAGCGNSTSNNSSAADNNTTNNTAAATESSDVTASADNVKIDTLNVYFVPSRDPDEIVTATEPLANLMQTELAGLGYDIGEVKITVGTTFEAVGEALAAGTADVGFIPGGTYVLYDDGADVILTATRDGLNKDSDNPADWNDGQPTEGTDKQAVSYRALFIAGPSDTSVYSRTHLHLPTTNHLKHPLPLMTTIQYPNSSYSIIQSYTPTAHVFV